MWYTHSFRKFSRSHARCAEAMKRSVERDLKEGMEIEGFLVNKVGFVPEFNMSMTRLRHVRTGCDYLHLARDDKNNVFSVSFRTTPTASTGLPHILEHTTLCGSHKYPCRDPFFKMLNRSMATFMNAFTGPDYTMYPFATQNRTDFNNLMSVYLDAVFRPNLRELDFKQEGWRLEHENINDRSSPIIFKGVVFNEMKGVFSENQSIFSEALLNNILPSHTYGVISGGDPKVIPMLTYADLKSFHKKYYHPSNCRIYSYGSFPLQDTLHFINKNYLADWPDLQDYGKATKVPSEPRWETERRKMIYCRPDPFTSNLRKQSTIAVSTLCNDIRSPQETFVMQVLSELLVKGPNSAFYKTLVEPNIGGGFNPVTGYDAQTRDSIFSVGLSCVDPNDFDNIVEIYHKTIDRVIEEGFDENSIKSILHTIELNTKHQSADFGLGVLFAITPIWNHDGDVTKMLKVNDKAMRLRKCLADNPLYFQDLVQEMLKDNAHQLILTMSPDEEYEAKDIAAENELLKQKLANIPSLQKDNIFTQGLELAKDQEMKQDVSVLPTLTISNLNSDVDRVKLKGYAIHRVPTQVCLHPTNGLTYFRGIINVKILSDEAKNVLPLFCSVVTKMGTKHYDYRQMDQQIQLKTGGISFSPHIAENIYDTNSYEEGVAFSSFCLDRNIKAMMGIWSEIFNSVNLQDQKRFETLVKITASNVIHGIADSGHLYALSMAASLISSSSLKKEQFSGLTFVQTMKELSQKSNLSDCLEMLNGIADVILKKKLMRLALNTSPETEDKILPCTEGFLKSIPGDFKRPFELSKPESFKKGIYAIHHILPFPVSYAAYCLPTVEYTHPDFPILRVMARLLTSKYLLVKIREKGGAYGAGANVSTAGIFSFYSYRDPKPFDTFNTFNAAFEWLRLGEFTDQDVEEAKLGVFQSIDAPIPPGSRGVRNFLFGISDDELQRHREIIMRLKKDDVIRVGSYLNSVTQGRALIGPSNPSILGRTKENWVKRITE
ncbi:presequence protease, mitochondrial [Cimex lectularius]|uniref:Presequence protease, mitochondrial n=1 Tax=Cimex lectularius TaxID=79782 RepID=A0A8I6S7P1_CIMLE|nr:presequence protease, mitochondrial [Cimex lectularius]